MPVNADLFDDLIDLVIWDRDTFVDFHRLPKLFSIYPS